MPFWEYYSGQLAVNDRLSSMVSKEIVWKMDKYKYFIMRKLTHACVFYVKLIEYKYSQLKETILSFAVDVIY